MTKLNHNGSKLIYSTFIGGYNRDYGSGIKIDSIGNAYVIGTTQEDPTPYMKFPTTPGAYDESYNGGGEVFVFKINSSGDSLLYSTFVGGGKGERALDFSLQTIDGKTVNLSDLEGQPVLLDFWAVWCSPCLEELTMLQNTDQDDLTILGIAVREPQEKVTDLASDQGLGFPLLLDPDGRVSDAYQVRGFPTSLFIDRNGLILARHVGPLDHEILTGYLNALSIDLPPPTAVP